MLVITISDDQTEACIEQVDAVSRKDVSSLFHFSQRTMALKTGEVITGWLIGVEAEAEIEQAMSEPDPEEETDDPDAMIGGESRVRPERDFIGGAA